ARGTAARGGRLDGPGRRRGGRAGGERHAPANRRGAARARGGAEELQGDRHVAAHRGHPAGGSRDGLRGRRPHGGGDGDAARVGAAGEARYGVNLTLITSPSVITWSRPSSRRVPRS